MGSLEELQELKENILQQRGVRQREMNIGTSKARQGLVGRVWKYKNRV